MKYLIACLGNIGPEYELTRHNIGFLAADRLADRHKVKFSVDKLAFHTEFKFKGRQIHIIKPTTYMNLSGKAINYWLQQLKIDKANLLVVVDDIALPLGKLRIRAKGSAAGHNGLKNIEQLCGGQDYVRLKMGVGDDFPKGRQVDYVLGNFNTKELEELPFALDKACDMIEGFCSIGLERTMNFFND